MTRALTLALSSCALASLANPATNAHAEVLVFEGAGTLTNVNPAADGFPASLASATTGDTFSIRVTLDTNATVNAPANTTGNLFETGSSFDLIEAELTVSGVDFNNFAGPHHGYIENNYDPFNNGSLRDGLALANIPNAGLPQFQFSNGTLPVNTFTAEAVPDADINGILILTMRQQLGTGFWFQGQTNTGFNVVPEPATATLALAGLTLIARRRRQA